jgi:hypothetical protein
MLPGVLSGAVAFETLTLGQGAGFEADYYVDNSASPCPNRRR